MVSGLEEWAPEIDSWGSVEGGNGAAATAATAATAESAGSATSAASAVSAAGLPLFHILDTKAWIL